MGPKDKPFRIRILPQEHWRDPTPRRPRSRCLNSFLYGVFGEGWLELTLENLTRALEGRVPFGNLFTHNERVLFIPAERIWETRRALDELRKRVSPEVWANLSNQVAGELILDSIYQMGYPVYR